MRAANRLLDQWAAEGIYFNPTIRTVWTISASTQDYTVGLSGTIVVARPVSGEKISQVNYYDSAVTPIVEIPLEFLTDDQWVMWPQKTLTGTYPLAWHYNPTYPSGVISLYPNPTGTGLRGVMYSASQIAAFAGLSDTIAMPPGYEEFLITNLAVNLAASYEREIPSSLSMRAEKAKAIVKRANRRLEDLSFPADSLIGAGQGTYDILSDTFR